MQLIAIDRFDSLEGWQPFASGQVKLDLNLDEGGCMRMDYDFAGGSGFAVARKALAFRLPEEFALRFRLKVDGLPNKFEFKLADPTNRNVWRWEAGEITGNDSWREIRLRRRDLPFAWGPAGGGVPTEIGAIEVAVVAGPGGAGHVWIGEILIEDFSNRPAPAVTASSSPSATNPDALLDETGTDWTSQPGDGEPWIVLDLHEPRDLGGLVLHLGEGSHRGFVIEGAEAPGLWRPLHENPPSVGAVRFIPLPDLTTRLLRIRFPGPANQPAALRRIELQPFEFSQTTNHFLHEVAAASPRGAWPRYWVREQSYWTPVGPAQGTARAVINEEGLVEVDEAGFSIEPFLRVAAHPLTWADARTRVSLADDCLPIPNVAWQAGSVSLDTTAFSHRADGHCFLVVRYRVTNHGTKQEDTDLILAVRPVQVTPPWQSFRKMGGASPIHEVKWSGTHFEVDGRKHVVSLTPGAKGGTACFSEGGVLDFLAAGELPKRTSTKDPGGLAFGMMEFGFRLAPGQRRDVFLAVPFAEGSDSESAAHAASCYGGWESSHDRALDEWRLRLSGVFFTLPESLREGANCFRTAAAQILVNRDGAALQPGPRRYTRSWIRDGAIMGAALIRAGLPDALRDFVRWYRPFQRDDGFVPCVVDRDGPDWLVEHDSHGQLIFSVMECFRFSGDQDFLAECWPAVERAAATLLALRKERLTAKWKSGEHADCYGLLPESASHEGYLAHHVHSYWDDFWGLQGLRDAAFIAENLGHKREAARWRKEHSAFREHVRTSVRAVIERKKLDYVPGSVEWADFDPTATSNALTMLDALADLPREVVESTFRKYLQGFRDKHSGRMDWNNYTAYEIRIIGALVRLGWRDEAAELVEFFLADRRPLEWNQWPEITWKDPRSPGHLGDLPHTWIASEYILAYASLFGYEDAANDSLVVAAGLPLRWLQGGSTVGVRGLPTWHGSLDLEARLHGDKILHVRVAGSVRVPSGGVVLRPPFPGRIRKFLVNGRVVEASDAGGAIVLRELPADVLVFEMEADGVIA